LQWHSGCYFIGAEWQVSRLAIQSTTKNNNDQMKLNSMTSILVKSAAALAVSTSMGFAGVSGKAPVPPPPPVEEPAALFDTIGAAVEVGYVTRNYYRGLWFSDNSVYADVSVSIPLTEALTWNVGVFWLTNIDNDGNHFGAPPGNPFDYSEYDLYTSFDYDLGFGSLSVGYNHYFYPNSYAGTLGGAPFVGGDFGVQDAGELQVVFGTSFYGFDWDIGYFYDFRIGGSYYESNLSYEIAVTPWLSLVPSFQIGWGNDYYVGIPVAGVPSSGLTHIQLGLAAPIALTPTASLTPFISWVSSDRTRNFLNNTTNNEIFGGVSLAVEF
jgi:hypothetical protein